MLFLEFLEFAKEVVDLILASVIVSAFCIQLFTRNKSSRLAIRTKCLKWFKRSIPIEVIEIVELKRWNTLSCFVCNTSFVKWLFLKFSIRATQIHYYFGFIKRYTQNDSPIVEKNERLHCSYIINIALNEWIFELE